MENVLAAAPIGVIAAAVYVLLQAGNMIGHRLGLRRRRIHGESLAEEQAEEAVITADTALLALLIAFSFGTAVQHHETRRTMTVAEVNAVRAAAIRIDMLKEPHAARLGSALRDYVDARVAGKPSATLNDPATNRLRTLIGAAANDASANGNVVRAVLDSTRDLFDSAAARDAARLLRIPHAVIGTMILYAVLAGALRGYLLGLQGRRNMVAQGILLLLLTVVVSLVIAIDRPGGSIASVHDRLMVKLQRELQAAYSTQSSPISR